MSSVLESIFIGGGLAFVAAVQPGPFQAFLFATVVEKGWRRTLPACFAPLLSDGPIAVLALFVLHRVPPATLHMLRVAGGLFLFYLAWATYRTWRRKISEKTGSDDPRSQTLIRAMVVNLLNPNPYLGWSLILGPSVMTAWHHHPPAAVLLVAAFYLTMMAVSACIILLFGTTRFFGTSGKQILILLSSAMLTMIALFQFYRGLSELWNI